MIGSENSDFQDLIPLKKIKIQWVYVVEIAGTWVQILGMALSRVFICHWCDSEGN